MADIVADDIRYFTQAMDQTLVSFSRALFLSPPPHLLSLFVICVSVCFPLSLSPLPTVLGLCLYLSLFLSLSLYLCLSLSVCLCLCLSFSLCLCLSYCMYVCLSVSTLFLSLFLLVIRPIYKLKEQRHHNTYTCTYDEQNKIKI